MLSWSRKLKPRPSNRGYHLPCPSYPARRRGRSSAARRYISRRGSPWTRTPRSTLSVPKIEGRYYTAQLLDEWGEVITNINQQRTSPGHPDGRFLLHAPDAAPPSGTAVAVPLHARKAQLLACVEIGNDRDGAVSLQHSFALTAGGDVRIAPPPPVPAFDNASLLGAEIFDGAAAVLASAAEPTPALRWRQSVVAAIARYVASGPEGRAEVDQRIRRDVVPGFQKEALTGISGFRDGWLIANIGGHYGESYDVRTAVKTRCPDQVHSTGRSSSSGSRLPGDRQSHRPLPPQQLLAAQPRARRRPAYRHRA